MSRKESVEAAGLQRDLPVQYPIRFRVGCCRGTAPWQPGDMPSVLRETPNSPTNTCKQQVRLLEISWLPVILCGAGWSPLH